MKVKFTVAERYAIADVYKEHEGHFPWEKHEPTDETYKALKQLWERMDVRYIKELRKKLV